MNGTGCAFQSEGGNVVCVEFIIFANAEELRGNPFDRTAAA